MDMKKIGYIVVVSCTQRSPCNRKRPLSVCVVDAIMQLTLRELEEEDDNATWGGRTV